MNSVGVGALVVLAVVSVVWTVLLIPALLELRRASWRLQEFIRTLELELLPTLQEAREGIRSMRQASQAVADGAAHLRGAMAAAWMDERDEATLYLARGRARPLWIGRSRSDLFFASTRRALAILEAALRLRLEAHEVREGRLLHVVGGRITRERRFRPDRSYREEGYLPPVRAPREAVSCLERLAALASAAA